MSDIDIRTIQYSIFDPIGNITALVETQFPEDEQPAAAAALMGEHPEVEQVGFVRFDENADLPVHLRMAGGEFCGNATMCAAALYLARYAPDGLQAGATVPVAAEGVREPVRVDLKTCTPDRAGYQACIYMPPVLSVTREVISCDGRRGELPCVREQGITHLIVDQDSIFYELLSQRDRAERVVREWCDELDADALGLMFLGKSIDQKDYDLTPLVYVPASGTVFWENSCASGAAAVAAAIARDSEIFVDIALRSPGGVIQAIRNAGGEIYLNGQVIKRK